MKAFKIVLKKSVKQRGAAKHQRLLHTSLVLLLFSIQVCFLSWCSQNFTQKMITVRSSAVLSALLQKWLWKIEGYDVNSAAGIHVICPNNHCLQNNLFANSSRLFLSVVTWHLKGGGAHSLPLFSLHIWTCIYVSHYFSNVRWGGKMPGLHLTWGCLIHCYQQNSDSFFSLLFAVQVIRTPIFYVQAKFKNESNDHLLSFACLLLQLTSKYFFPSTCITLFDIVCLSSFILHPFLPVCGKSHQWATGADVQVSGRDQHSNSGETSPRGEGRPTGGQWQPSTKQRS